MNDRIRELHGISESAMLTIDGWPCVPNLTLGRDVIDPEFDPERARALIEATIAEHTELTLDRVE